MRGMRSEAVNDSEKIITMEENPYTNIMKSAIIQADCVPVSWLPPRNHVSQNSSAFHYVKRIRSVGKLVETQHVDVGLAAVECAGLRGREATHHPEIEASPT